MFREHLVPLVTKVSSLADRSQGVMHTSARCMHNLHVLPRDYTLRFSINSYRELPITGKCRILSDNTCGQCGSSEPRNACVSSCSVGPLRLHCFSQTIG